MNAPLQFEYDEQKDQITIEGINYSGCIFRQLGGLMEVSSTFKLHRRDNGVLTIKKLQGANELPMIGERAEELRQMAMEWAIKTQQPNCFGESGVIWAAEKYVNYILKGTE